MIIKYVLISLLLIILGTGIVIWDIKDNKKAMSEIKESNKFAIFFVYLFRPRMIYGGLFLIVIGTLFFLSSLRVI